MTEQETQQEQEQFIEVAEQNEQTLLEMVEDWYRNLPKTPIKEWKPEERVAYVKNSLVYIPELIGQLKFMQSEAERLGNELILRDERVVELEKSIEESGDGAKSADSIYHERNLCVAALARLAIRCGYKSGLGKHEHKEGESWDLDWENIVFVELPTGQVSWHIHEKELKHFRFLGEHVRGWDGHTTEEKYKRIDDLFQYMNFK